MRTFIVTIEEVFKPPPRKQSSKRSYTTGALETIRQLLKQSTTRKEIMNIVGWKSVSVHDQAKQLGVPLYVDRRTVPYQYTSDPHYAPIGAEPEEL